MSKSYKAQCSYLQYTISSYHLYISSLFIIFTNIDCVYYSMCHYYIYIVNT